MTDLAAYTIWVPTLLMVVFRLAGLFLTAPVLSQPAIPPPAKAIVCLAVGLAVTARISAPLALPGDWLTLIMGLGGEVLIGATLGYAASLLFAGIELGGEHIGQQLGISLASVFNPMFQESSSVLSTTLSLASLCIFLVIGGHRVLIHAVLDSFGQVPLMGFAMHVGVLNAVVTMLGASFVLAIKISAPVMVAMFLASLSLGFIQRTMPQLNILSTGFQIRIILGLVILIASMAMLVPLVETAWGVLLKHMATIFQ